MAAPLMSTWQNIALQMRQITRQEHGGGVETVVFKTSVRSYYLGSTNVARQKAPRRQRSSADTEKRKKHGTSSTTQKSRTRVLVCHAGCRHARKNDCVPCSTSLFAAEEGLHVGVVPPVGYPKGVEEHRRFRQDKRLCPITGKVRVARELCRNGGVYHTGFSQTLHQKHGKCSINTRIVSTSKPGGNRR